MKEKWPRCGAEAPYSQARGPTGYQDRRAHRRDHPLPSLEKRGLQNRRPWREGLGAGRIPVRAASSDFRTQSQFSTGQILDEFGVVHTRAAIARVAQHGGVGSPRGLDSPVSFAK